MKSQIGDAVPPLVAKIFFKNIVEVLREPDGISGQLMPLSGFGNGISNGGESDKAEMKVKEADEDGTAQEKCDIIKKDSEGSGDSEEVLESTWECKADEEVKDEK